VSTILYYIIYLTLIHFFTPSLWRITRFNASPLYEALISFIVYAYYCCRFNLNVIEYCRRCARGRRRWDVSITPLIVYFCIFMYLRGDITHRAPYWSVSFRSGITGPAGELSSLTTKIIREKYLYDINGWALTRRLHSGPQCVPIQVLNSNRAADFQTLYKCHRVCVHTHEIYYFHRLTKRIS